MTPPSTERPGRRSGWWMDRSDWIGTQVLLALVLAACLGAYLLPAVASWLSGDPLVVESQVPQTAPVPDLQPLGGASVAYDGHVRWTLPGATTGQWLLSLLPVVLTSGLVVAGTVLVWRLARRVRRQDPFGPAALRAVRGLALLVLAYGLLIPVIRLAVTFVVLAPVQARPELSVTVLPWQAAPLVIGWLLLVLAEAYRHGERLRDDVTGLV